MLISSVSSSAAFQELWQVGQPNSNNEEFENGQNDERDEEPGSASVLDDHYYLTGTYPDPIGFLAADEPLENFEPVVSRGDPLCRIYFPIPSATPSEILYSLRFRIQWCGYWIPDEGRGGETPGNHHFRVRCNGVEVGDLQIAGFEEHITDFQLSFAGENLTPEGFNYIEIEHLGGTTATGDPLPGGYWASIDYVSLSADPVGLQDTDEDGLPLYWESQYYLSDLNSNDASSDTDQDGLTAIEEFANGTSPLNADTDRDGLIDSLETLSDPLVSDTDGDGLKDGVEVLGAIPSHPALTDSDNDGVGDSLETALGFDPENNSETPPSFSGAIAINFVHNSSTLSRLSETTATGVLPQYNWNQTRPLSWGEQSGDQTDIQLPIENTLVDAEGQTTGVTIQWTSSNTIPQSHVGEDTDLPSHRLFKGNIAAYADGENSEEFEDATVSFQNIPYSTYDLIVYMQSEGSDPNSRITLNNDPDTSRFLNSLEFEVIDGFKESVTYGEERIGRGNHLRFRNLQGSTCSLRLHSEAWQVLLSAIQIIDMSADTDSDGMPDAWEREHGLNLANGNDANEDPDEDSLDNASEYAQLTNPNQSDSDNDGLSDGVETNTGIYVDSNNTGTNPNHPDSDGDGIADLDELTTTGFRTDPNNPDSDGDGLDDGEEASANTDPNDLTVSVLPVPFMNPSNDEITWAIDDLRIRMDRSKGHGFTEWGAGPGIEFQLLNSSENEQDWYSLNMGLAYNDGLLGYFFSASASGAFSNQGDGLRLAHWSWLPEQEVPDDISQGIGFSEGGTYTYSDRITLRFTATRETPNTNSWTTRFEIINKDRAETVVNIFRTGITAANSVNNGTAFWTNRDALPWPNIHLRGSGISYDFGDNTISDQSLYQEILDTDKDGLTDVFENQYGLAANNPADGSIDSDNDGLDNATEQLLGLNPNEADSDGDNVSDYWEVRYASDGTDAKSAPFTIEMPPSGVGEDFDGDGQSDVWEMLRDVLPDDGDEDLDGFANSTEVNWGTDPFNPFSTPELSIRYGEESIELEWPQLLYKDFDFEQSQTLNNWSALSGTLQNHTRSTSLDISGSNEDRWFFRLNVRGDLTSGASDADNDRVGNWTENLLGLSSLSQETSWSNTHVDTDSDGEPDTEMSGDLFHTYALISDGLNGSPLSDLHASRFLSQATFGPTSASINNLKKMGLEAWLDEQIEAIPATLLQDVFLGFYDDYHGPRVKNDYYSFDDDNPILPMFNMRTAWGRAALSGQDQLRQRVAFALSQILVISGRDANLDRMPISVAGYYDNFINNAFGNYYDILEYVTFNACMGLYLSHIGNQKAQPELNIFPDENYARELMQLFTIGLWELNPDGTRRLDENGEPIPTYGQTEITELARVMTGFWFTGEDFGEGGWNDRSGLKPMQLHVPQHDFSSKLIVGGHTIPAREPTLDNAYQDVKDAVRLIFENTNTPVFISKQLIQFLVSDNPSPEYVERVQAVFADNGAGERGDLGAVVRAILMDPEARSPLYFANSNQTGFLKEPVIRLMQMGRVFKVADRPDFQMWQLYSLEEDFSQDPLNAPSVFNFFKPHYEPSGILGDEGMVGPVFQILHSYSAISGPHQIWDILQEGFSHPWLDSVPQPFDYSEFLPFENDAEALIEKINILFCQGMMSPGTRSAIQEALNKLDDLENLPPGVPTQVATWVAICGPSGATQL